MLGLVIVQRRRRFGCSNLSPNRSGAERECFNPQTQHALPEVHCAKFGTASQKCALFVRHSCCMRRPRGRNGASTAYTCEHRAIATAMKCGLFLWEGVARPPGTAQNRHARVHVSPMSMMVAVGTSPLQHSPMLGHLASSHTCGKQTYAACMHACGRGESLCRCEVQLAQRRLECFVPAHHRCCHSVKRCSAPTPAPSQTPLCSAHPISQKSDKSAPFAAWNGFDLQPGGLGTDEAQAVFGTLVFRSLLPQAGR